MTIPNSSTQNEVDEVCQVRPSFFSESRSLASAAVAAAAAAAVLGRRRSLRGSGRAKFESNKNKVGRCRSERSCKICDVTNKLRSTQNINENFFSYVAHSTMENVITSHPTAPGSILRDS